MIVTFYCGLPLTILSLSLSLSVKRQESYQTVMPAANQVTNENSITGNATALSLVPAKTIVKLREVSEISLRLCGIRI